MVTIDANPMPLVHSVLYGRCTRRIGFASIVTVLSPIKTQDYTHVFFSVAVQFVPQPTQKFVQKNRLTDRHLFRKIDDFGPPKTGTHLYGTNLLRIIGQNPIFPAPYTVYGTIQLCPIGSQVCFHKRKLE